MIIRGQDRGVALGEGGLGGGIGGWALAPGLTQHRRCLRTSTGAGERLSEALRGLDAAWRDAGEMAQHQRVVRVLGQQFLGAAGDGLGQGPIGVGGEPGGDLRPRGRAIPRLDPQPGDQLAGHRVGAAGQRLGFGEAAGLGGGQRLAAGLALRFARPGLGGGRAGEEKGQQGKAEETAHAPLYSAIPSRAAALPPSAPEPRFRGPTRLSRLGRPCSGVRSSR